MARHKKSRYGCSECKQRKVKCDESRPSCVRCRTSDRRCSYRQLGSAFGTPAPPHQSAASSPSVPPSACSETLVNTPSSAAPSFESDAISAGPAPFPTCLSLERYSLFHFELLLHFRGPLAEAMSSTMSDMGSTISLTVSEALRNPFLMDEVLAYAAAHKSTLAQDPKIKALYRTEATRLQSRAIGQLNITEVNVTEDNVLPLFFFALVLGQHVIFDTFSAAASLPAILEELGRCLTLHRGIRAIVSQSLERFKSVVQKHCLQDPVYWQHDVINSLQGGECDSLLQRLRDCDTGESTRATYLEVVGILQYAFDSVRSRGSRKFAAIQEWMVRIPESYTSLLQERRPEALVILAHYAVLLHMAQDYWIIGNSGGFLVRAISRHLGSHWADWLSWPKQELGISSAGTNPAAS